jgi:hydroxymethylpyrimidine/phosphomethylpyrimidine kinase
MRVALTIAGSDSVAGAGIQADLKTFAALGVYGVSVITAVTSQSTTGVADVCALPSPMVRSQIEQLVDDVEIFAVKTGMLATAETVEVVAATLGRLGHLNLVVDPVMAATIAARTLLPQDAVSLLKTRLLPLASVVTPNVAEATALSGVCVDSASRAREAARRIADLGARAVVIKGGHLAGAEAVDLLFHEGTFVEFAAPRCPFESVHGTGCTFASAIAARLAFGDNIPAAVERAKQYVTGAIERSFAIGRGARILNHFWESPAGGLYS